MFELFKTVLILSIIGSVITTVLLLLKPITSKRFPARWQYYIWMLVMLFMVLPVWKLLPARSPQMPVITETATAAPTADIIAATVAPTAAPAAAVAEIPPEYRSINIASASVRIYDIIAAVWLAGAAVFIASALVSYVSFLIKRHRASYELSECELFERIKQELGIRRKIRLRVYPEDEPPMLVGALRPVVYMPGKTLDEKSAAMIFLHELTHLKRGDLIYKWLTLLVNAVHWFNPFAYLLSANVGEACEVSCDMAVTKNMDENEISLYMKTILDLADRKKEGKQNV